MVVHTLKTKVKKLKIVDRYIMIMVEKSRNNLRRAKADDLIETKHQQYEFTLSKSRGQILRVAAVLHVLFHLDTPLNIPEAISDQALLAAQNFVELCNQYMTFLAGRREIAEAIDNIQNADKGIMQ